MSMQTKTVQDIFEYIKGVVVGCEIIPTAGLLPSFLELKSSPDKFYDLFSEATYKYNVICDTLQKLQHANAMIIKVLNDLMNAECKETFNVKSQYIKNFTNLRTECTALIAGYETAKASAESIVKYFNSAQFVICNSRYFDTHANY